MADVKFHNFTIEVKGAISDIAYRAVEEACGELESQTKSNTVVRTGKTKNSWTHDVSGSDSEVVGTVGSPEENAIWEEFGTGDYALHNNGRKGGWFYVDEMGKGHFTHGKKPRRAFWHAYSSLKNKLIKHIQDAFKGGLS